MNIRFARAMFLCTILLNILWLIPARAEQSDLSTGTSKIVLEEQLKDLLEERKETKEELTDLRLFRTRIETIQIALDTTKFNPDAKSDVISRLKTSVEALANLPSNQTINRTTPEADEVFSAVTGLWEIVSTPLEQVRSSVNSLIPYDGELTTAERLLKPPVNHFI